jgi:hypothetical protein
MAMAIGILHFAPIDRMVMTQSGTHERRGGQKKNEKTKQQIKALGTWP